MASFDVGAWTVDRNWLALLASFSFMFFFPALLQLLCKGVISIATAHVTHSPLKGAEPPAPSPISPPLSLISDVPYVLKSLPCTTTRGEACPPVYWTPLWYVCSLQNCAKCEKTDNEPTFYKTTRLLSAKLLINLGRVDGSSYPHCPTALHVGRTHGRCTLPPWTVR